MRPYEVFASRFGAKVAFNPQFILEKSQRYYLLNPRLKKVGQEDFFYAGLYLGKVGKNGGFFPSFNLLNMLVDVAANKIVVDRKAAWLFICGRDVFGTGIVKVMGFADDDAVDAYPSRHDPLFGAALRRVGMLPQQPIQQRADLGRHFKSDFRLRSRDKVERVAMSLRRRSAN